MHTNCCGAPWNRASVSFRTDTTPLPSFYATDTRTRSIVGKKGRSGSVSVSLCVCPFQALPIPAFVTHGKEKNGTVSCFFLLPLYGRFPHIRRWTPNKTRQLPYLRELHIWSGGLLLLPYLRGRRSVCSWDNEIRGSIWRLPPQANVLKGGGGESPNNPEKDIHIFEKISSTARGTWFVKCF